MAGYTPTFDTLLTGTLYGKWPHNGIWALLLSRADRDGVINETPECIAGHIGIPVSKLMKSIEYFMQPDPHSRSANDDGRRLELIDPDRSWGWRIVNHGKYRERARLMTKNAREVEEGANRERMRDRRGPPGTAGDRLSESESESESGGGGASAPLVGQRRKQPPVLHDTLPQDAWAEWLEHRRKKRWPNDATTLQKQLKVLAPFDQEIQRQMLETSIQAGWQGIFPPRGSSPGVRVRAKSVAELEAEEAARAGVRPS